MFKTLANIFRVPELRNKVLFTLLMLAIYRVGYHVPIPGVDQEVFAEMANPGYADYRKVEVAFKAAQSRAKDAQTDADRAQKEAAAAPGDSAKQAAAMTARAAADAAAADVDAGRRALQAAAEQYNRRRGEHEQSGAGRLADYISIFSGGSLSQSTIFGLGVMPYISSSIIFQLLATVVPSLEKLQKEGETGRKKIQEWTRYATVPLCIVQAIFWISYMHNAPKPLVQAQFYNTFSFWLMAITCLTAGCVFLMWLGEQIDEYGLGNGVSLIILAGIVARMPQAFALMWQLHDFNPGASQGEITIGKIVFLAVSFVFIVAGSILITQAQRRIPVQQAKHTRGRRVYGGSRQYLPLRVNHGGVMPIIFAQSLMLFPGVAFGALNSWINGNGNPTGAFGGLISFLNEEFKRGSYIYIITEIVMIYFFAYFWTTVQFQPKEMANQLRDYGSFIPGLRPGKRTADYLEKVMMRMTYVGAAFLCLIAVIPTAISAWLGIHPQISAFLGGTGLLIVVSVALDMVQRIEANLLMRNYSGFLGGPGHKGKRIKGRQY